jgi:PAS domain S-box-containing protein
MNIEDMNREQLAAEVQSLRQRLSHPENLGRNVVSRDETLAATLERLRAVFAGSADPILITDLKDTVLEFNPAVTRVFGYSADELVGHTFPGHTGLDKGSFEEWLATCQQGGSVRDHETVRRHKNGTHGLACLRPPWRSARFIIYLSRRH